MTIYDVARQAGVSHQTVSRVINDRPGVAAETRQRVLYAAQQLRFVPNRAAQGLRSRAHNPVGCVIVAEVGREALLSASAVQRLLSANATVLLRVVERGNARDREDAINSLEAEHVTRLLLIDAGAVEEILLNPPHSPHPSQPTGPNSSEQTMSSTRGRADGDDVPIRPSVAYAGWACSPDEQKPTVTHAVSAGAVAALCGAAVAAQGGVWGDPASRTFAAPCQVCVATLALT